MILILFLANLLLRNAGRAHFSELFQWAAWCYGDHPLSLFARGTLRSESGVHQGDPLVPLLVLIGSPEGGLLLLQLTQFAHSFHFTQDWYMDDGSLLGQNRKCYRHSALLNSLVLH